MSTDDDLTLAYLDGLHTGRKQEQERILKIAYDECLACGSVGGQSWLNIKSAVRNQPSEVKT